MEFATLANGLRVVSRTMSGLETVAVGLYTDTGSRFESEAENGVAHLFEHMVFKGAGGRSARAIAEAVEDVGGSINAYTSRDSTVFHARLLAQDLALGVDLIADLVRAPHFDEDELVRERQVVLQELGEARDTPDDIVFDHLQEAAYPGQAIGRSILGSEQSLAGIGVHTLKRWQEVQYRPGSMILAGAGKIDHDALVRLGEARFGDLAPGTRPAAETAYFRGGVHADKRKFEQAHLTIAWAGLPQLHAEQMALRLFVEAAGGGMSSRLFQELREERGLAYSVYASAHSFEDGGMVSAYCACSRRDAAKTLALAEAVMADCAAKLDAREFERARAQVKAGLLMGLESAQGQADYCARQLSVHGRLVPPAEVIAEIEALTLERVRAAGTAMLAGPRAVASVGASLAKAA